MKKKTLMAIRLPYELKQALKMKCCKLNMSMSEVILNMIHDYVNK